MPKLIQVPGLGTVEFPDNLTPNQIQAAISSHMANRVAPPVAAPSPPSTPAPQPSILSRWLGSGIPSETDIRARMAQIEEARRRGSVYGASKMDAAGQVALHRLLRGGNMAGALFDPPLSSQSIPQPTPPPPKRQGGVWAEAENEEIRKRLNPLGLF